MVEPLRSNTERLEPQSLEGISICAALAIVHGVTRCW